MKNLFKDMDSIFKDMDSIFKDFNFKITSGFRSKKEQNMIKRMSKRMKGLSKDISEHMATFINYEHTSSETKFEAQSHGLSSGVADAHISTFIEYLESGEFWMKLTGCAHSPEYECVIAWDWEESGLVFPVKCFTHGMQLKTIMMIHTDLVNTYIRAHEEYISDIVDVVNVLGGAIYMYVVHASPHMRDKFLEIVDDDLFGNANKGQYEEQFKAAMALGSWH